MKNTLQGGSMGFFRVNTYLIYLVFARPYENAKTTETRKHVHWRKMYRKRIRLMKFHVIGNETQ